MLCYEEQQHKGILAMSNVVFDMSSIRAFVERLGAAAKGEFKKEMTLFLQGLGSELLRLIQDEIISRKVMDSRLLLASFHKGHENNVWVIEDKGLTLEVGTNITYAEWRNDGHWMNPKGVDRRWVPGYWQGDRFVYDPGARTGMSLKQQWIEGSHYFDAAIQIFEKMFPRLIESKMDKWLADYFKEFV